MISLRKAVIGTTVLLMSMSATSVVAKQGHSVTAKQLERGRYLVRIGGCNDCHTPGYTQAGGAVPEKDWLLGDKLGWRGPWGTTYPANLRLYMNGITEKEWVKTAHTQKFRPPMPWFALHAMTTNDLKAIYQFVRHLGPAGQAAPDYIPPGHVAAGPVVQFPEPPKQ